MTYTDAHLDACAELWAARRDDLKFFGCGDFEQLVAQADHWRRRLARLDAIGLLAPQLAVRARLDAQSIRRPA